MRLAESHEAGQWHTTTEQERGRQPHIRSVLVRTVAEAKELVFAGASGKQLGLFDTALSELDEVIGRLRADAERYRNDSDMCERLHRAAELLNGGG